MVDYFKILNDCSEPCYPCGIGCMKSCRGCVTGTGRPGSLSNGYVSVNEENNMGILQQKLVLNWATLDQRQKLIQNTVRVPSSLYTDNLSSSSSYLSPEFKKELRWNQSSDRWLPSGLKIPVNNNVTSRGNSTKRSLTRCRPGASTPSSNNSAMGVDIKHNSYARYLNRLKGKTIQAPKDAIIINGYNIPASRPKALQGGKNVKFSITNCRCKNLE
jgi:hypothetical protein